MTVTRRGFLTFGLSLIELITSNRWQLNLCSKHTARKRILLIVRLAGGNDGLNTVVPYGHELYYQARKQLAISYSEVLPLTSLIGFHPSLIGFYKLFEQNKLAIIQAVGYPNAGSSHYRCLDIWQTGEPNRIIESTWIERFLGQVTSIQESKGQFDHKFCQKITQKLDSINQQQRAVIPSFHSNTSFGDNLSRIAEMIIAGYDSCIYEVCLDGFDTHTNQVSKHAQLLSQLSTGLLAFQKQMEVNALDDDVLVLVFSEFGRRFYENNSGGTDHGTAQPLFVIGSAVRGGIYGDHPILTDLHDGNLAYLIDFRKVYATIIDNFLLGDSTAILGGKFEHVSFL